ncbi:MAG: ester cyclase [Planctomycetes bacterium]|nr:ester cyclase [Planctomycetota bacterium]
MQTRTKTLTPAQMDEAMDRHFGFEAADDIDGVLSTLTPDAEHDIVGSPGGPTRGREPARAFYEQMYRDLANGRITTKRRLYGDGFLVDESFWEGTAQGTPFGLEGRGRPIAFRLLHVMEFSDDGLIARENCWIDLSAVLQQLPQDG